MRANKKDILFLGERSLEELGGCFQLKKMVVVPVNIVSLVFL